MSDYMDYPFICDEKTGDRCLKQCEGCRSIEQQKKETPNAYWERINQVLENKAKKNTNDLPRRDR